MTIYYDPSQQPAPQGDSTQQPVETQWGTKCKCECVPSLPKGTLHTKSLVIGASAGLIGPLAFRAWRWLTGG